MTRQTLKIGAIEVISVSDVVGPFFTLSDVFPAMSEADWIPIQERYPEVFTDDGMWNTRAGSFIVRASDTTILVDTGVGPGPVALVGGLRGRLLDELEQHGVPPEAIDIVFLTHLHPDHVGWNLTPDGAPTFPAARYVVSHADWETFQNPEVKAAFRNVIDYIDRDVTPLGSLGVLELISGETRLLDGVTAIPTPGHTPGHQSLQLDADGQRLLILGDVLFHPGQVMRPDIVFSFDMDPETNIASRRRVIEQLAEERSIAAGGHFPEPGFGRIVDEAGEWRWQPLETG
jgi:glyoxylase-like metal-dependent hydrolase (beta-lactamase superfamily II)